MKLVPIATELDIASRRPMYLSSTMLRLAGMRVVNYRNMSRPLKRMTKEWKAVRRTGETARSRDSKLVVGHTRASCALALASGHLSFRFRIFLLIIDAKLIAIDSPDRWSSSARCSQPDSDADLDKHSLLLSVHLILDELGQGQPDIHQSWLRSTPHIV